MRTWYSYYLRSRFEEYDSDDSLDSENRAATLVCKAITTGSLGEEPEHSFEDRCSISPQYHWLLPEGKRYMDQDLFWSITEACDIEDDTENDVCYWPFFHTQFVLTETSANRIRRRENRQMEEDFRYGNGAAFQVFWYTDVALTMTAGPIAISREEPLCQADEDSKIATMSDRMELVWVE